MSPPRRPLVDRMLSAHAWLCLALAALLAVLRPDAPGLALRGLALALAARFLAGLEPGTGRLR